MFAALLDWIEEAPLWLLGLVLLAGMIAAACGGHELCGLRRRKAGHAKGEGKSLEDQESYIVSAVLGLLALLLGFTFSLATDRFEARRALVVDHANAIGTAFLQSQLLGEPHRTRLSGLLVAYTANAVALGNAPRGQTQKLLDADDRIITQIWAATASGFDSIRPLAFSSTFVESFNHLIDMDGARRALRATHVPTEVFAVLLLYLIVAAGVLGYVLSGTSGRLTAGFLLGLITLSLLLILDIDRPTAGNIHESQKPMEDLLVSLRAQPITVYDRWRSPGQETPAR